MSAQPEDQETRFRLEEATIHELHAAIKAGRTTVVEIVRAAVVVKTVVARKGK